MFFLGCNTKNFDAETSAALRGTKTTPLALTTKLTTDI
jgi:hypothetical protein